MFKLLNEDRAGALQMLTREADRMATTAHRVGYPRELLTAEWSNTPGLLSVVLRDGVTIRSVHHIMACLHPDRPAVVDEDRELTYEELNNEINRLANALRHRFGIGRKDPVVVAMRNRTEYLVTWMALSRLGAATVHASWRQTAEEMAYQIEDSGATLAVAGRSVADAMDELAGREGGDDLRIIGVDDGIGEFSYKHVVDGSPDDYPFRSDETPGSENVVYTSGTTGRPKGAVRDLASFGVVELLRILERLPVRTADRHLLVSPMYHSGGQVFSLLNAALGATVYMLPKFDAETTLRRLHREAINTVFLVPTMLRRILDLPDEVRDEASAPALRGIFCGAAPFPQPLRERAIEEFGASAIHDFYGATEIGWITLINGEEMLERPGSVGRPIAGQQVRIVDDDGRELEPGRAGRIYVRNEHVMSGYLHREEATDEIVDEGWMTVEDLGHFDEDGYLYLAGRERDMVISGGVNIYPAEIEEVLEGHEAIREVAVIGVPDEEWGERLEAVAAVDGEVDVEELEAFAREELSGYKIPSGWHFVDELPRNATGKVLKRKLEERFGDGD